jgi:protein TonB
VPDRAAPAPPDQYGPAPGPDAAGPEPVPMSELEFSRFVEPRYPRSRSARNSRGWVEVQFRVDAEGNTADVRVVAAEPPGLFDDAATAAVERWRFKPKVVDGEAVAVNSAVRLRFEP